MHQRNVYIKRKLGLWRVRKCISLVSAKSALTCSGPQITSSHVRRHIGPRTEIWGNLGLLFTMVQCFHQSNVYIKRKLGLWRVRKCIPLLGAKSALDCAGPQTTPSHVRRHRAENGNLGKSVPTFRHGAVFAPKLCLYQKETRAMESSKLYSSRWCNKRTYLCGTANYPVSCKAA